MVGAISTNNSWAEGALIFSEDNSLLLTNHDNAARLWDVATGQQIGVEFPNAERILTGVNFGDTLQLVTGASESGARVEPRTSPSGPGTACRVAGSNLTRDEWDQWGPRDEDYRSICDQYPIEAWTDVGFHGRLGADLTRGRAIRARTSGRPALAENTGAG